MSLFKLNKSSIITLTACLFVSNIHAFNELSLQESVNLAIKQDIWQQKAMNKEQALIARSHSVSSLPDPKLSIEMSNVPVDTLNLDQEAMTQIKLGVSQQFSRGNSLELKQQKLRLSARAYPVQLRLRQAKIAQTVAEHWLDAYLAKTNMQLIEQYVSLFEQMVDISKANYASTVGSTRQQDVIRAQLQLIKLQDRLNKQYQDYLLSHSKLVEWLMTEQGSFVEFSIDLAKPQFGTLNTQVKNILSVVDVLESSEIQQIVQAHPEIQVIELNEKIASKQIELQQQAYQPEWGMKASYGYRQDDDIGNNRADLFSVGLSVDLPLFTDSKQDKNLAASRYELEAVKTDKALKWRELSASLLSQLSQYKILQQRQKLYDQALLDQVHEQAEAALTAYTNDDGEFSEVVTARIYELETELLANDINVQLAKSLIRIAYFLSPNTMTADMSVN